MVPYQSLGGPTEPVTPRTLRTKYALWLSSIAVLLALCAFFGTIVRFYSDSNDTSIGFRDPFFSSDNRSGKFSRKTKGPRPLLIAEEDLSLDDLEALLGNDGSRRESTILKRLQEATLSRARDLEDLLQRAVEQYSGQIDEGSQNDKVSGVRSTKSKENETSG